jgi:hypothetical protein
MPDLQQSERVELFVEQTEVDSYQARSFLLELWILIEIPGLRNFGSGLIIRSLRAGRRPPACAPQRSTDTLRPRHPALDCLPVQNDQLDGQQTTRIEHF